MSKNKTRFILYTVILLVAIGAITAYLMWNAPRRDVTNEKGIEVSAQQLFADFDKDSSYAYSTYLNKAIQVTGTVSGVNKDADGKISSITLQVDSSGLNSVQCGLKDGDVAFKEGTTVTIKGICTGFTGGDELLGFKDVKLSECVLMK